MSELIPTILFYVFAGLTVLSGLAVITSKNPVYSVLFLILAFFNSAGLFVLLGAEYLAMTLVIVYVGAVAVLFLFVVMMLNVNFEELREGFARYLPLGIGVAAVIFIELVTVMSLSLNGLLRAAPPTHATPDPQAVNNTLALGRILYTDYAYLFQIAGLILLVAMIGAIVLTHRHRPGVRKQNIHRQMARKRSDAMTVVQVESGKGIK